MRPPIELAAMPSRATWAMHLRPNRQTRFQTHNPMLHYARLYTWTGISCIQQLRQKAPDSTHLKVAPKLTLTPIKIRKWVK